MWPWQTWRSRGTRSRFDRESAAGGPPVGCRAGGCLPAPSIERSDSLRAFGSGGLSGEPRVLPPRTRGVPCATLLDGLFDRLCRRVDGPRTVEALDLPRRDHGAVALPALVRLHRLRPRSPPVRRCLLRRRLELRCPRARAGSGRKPRGAEASPPTARHALRLQAAQPLLVPRTDRESSGVTMARLRTTASTRSRPRASCSFATATR